MPAFITLKRGYEEQPADEVYISMPEKRRTTMRDVEMCLNQLDLNSNNETKTKRIRGRFKRVDQTTKPGIHEWVYRNSLSTATAQNKPTEVTDFSHPSKKASYTTISCREGEMDFSSDAIQFENCMCEVDFRGRLTDSAFGICMSLVSTGCVDIDHRLTLENRYTHYTLLGIVIDTDDMEKAIELLNNGADPCISLPSNETPASIFWKKLTRMTLPESDLHSEVYKLIKEAVDKKTSLEEENRIGNGIVTGNSFASNPNNNVIYDVYMCVDEMEIEEEEGNKNGNSNDLVYEELVKQENAAILCYTELSYITYVFPMLEDVENESDFDSEDSNAEGYYDRICDAYGYGDEERDEYEEDDDDYYYHRRHPEIIVDDDFEDDWGDDDMYENEYYDGYRDDYGDYRDEDYDNFEDSW